MSVKPLSRSAGKSAVASAAYRAGERLVDERTGEVKNYANRSGVVSSHLVMPEGTTWAPTRGELWNSVEAAEKRKDSCVAIEHVIALPSELTSAQREKLALAYCRDLAKRHGSAVDVSLHAPDKAGDNRNWHMHVMRSTRVVTGNGLGAKCDDQKAGRKAREQLQFERKRWEQACNAALKAAGHEARIDHRSNRERGLQELPTQKEGPTATQMKRAGVRSERVHYNDLVRERNQVRREELQERHVQESVRLPSVAEWKRDRERDRGFER